MGLLSEFSDNLPHWLPDDPNKNAAMRAGLLNFGAALMGGRGNIGSILGGGLMAGTQGYSGSLAAQQATQLQAMQAQHYDMQNKGLKAALDEPMALAKIAASVSQPGAVAPVFALPQIGQPGAARSLANGAMQPQASAPDAPDSSQAATVDGALDGYQAQDVPASDAALPPDAPAPRGVLPVESLPQVGQVAPQPAPQAAPKQSPYEYYSALSQAYAANGKTAAAKTAAEIADKYKPKYSTEFRVAVGPDGKMHNYITSEDGSFKDSGLGVKPDMVESDLGGKKIWSDKNALQPGQSFDKTVTPGEALQSSDQAKSRGQAERHWKAEQDVGGEVPITSDAITNAAARYNLDGTLPPMGMGKAAAAGRSAILNKAAELAAGVDPTDQRKNQIGAKNELKSQGAALTQFTSGKLGNTVRSFNVLQSHLDTFSNMAEALDNGDVQMINRIGNAIAAQTGKAAPTNFEAIKHIVGDEIVKAVTGSAGALGDREAAAKTIASANSPAQLRGVIATYKELARGQLGGLQKQYEASTGRKDFDKMLTQSAQEARSPSASPKPKAPTAHPADINDLMKKYGAH